MEHPEDMPGWQSASDTVPHDGSIIVRSDPFSDLRPFIEHLWVTRCSMCCNIYPDEFPRGTNDRGATKDEEDEFLRRYFSASDIHLQGARFLKQVLYSIARYNEDNVLACAVRWTQEYQPFYAAPAMDPAQIRHVLDEHQSANFPGSFLSRAALVISHELQQSSVVSVEPEAVQKVGAAEGRLHEQSLVDAVHQPSFVPGRLTVEPLPPTTQPYQPPQRHVFGAGQDENIQSGISMLHGPPPSARLASRQPYKQETRTRRRRSSGSMHTPQGPMGPGYMGPMTPVPHMAATHASVDFPEFDSGFSDFVDALPGYMQVVQQMPPDTYLMNPNMHPNTGYHSPSPYAPGPKSRTPQHTGNYHPFVPMSGQHPGNNETQPFQHQRSGSFNQYAPRSSFSHAPNSPRLVDPNSFARFSGDRFPQQRPHAPHGPPSLRGGHRSSFNSSKPRRPSARSGDAWQGQRDGKPFEGPQRRVHSDQREYMTYATESKHGTRENRSQSDTVGERGYSTHRNNRQAQAFHQASAFVYDPDWSCGPDYIGNRRVDVDCLVIGNLPPGTIEGPLEMYLRQEINCIHVSLKPFPQRTTMWITFRSFRDAQCALKRRDLEYEGTRISLRVPFRFWKQTDNEYIFPAEARLAIESNGNMSQNNRNHRSFSGGGYYWRRPSRSERSVTGSEAGYPLQGPASAFVKTLESISQTIISEEGTASDLSDQASPSIGYTGPVLPTLSEASTPQKCPSRNTFRRSPRKTPPRNRILSTRGPSESPTFQSEGCHKGVYASHEQVSRRKAQKQLESETISFAAVSTAETSLSDELVDKGSSLSTPRASSPIDIAVTTAEAWVDKDSCDEDCSVISEPNKQRNSSPKTTEDADDSFQTAAETPEAATRVFTPSSTPGSDQPSTTTHIQGASDNKTSLTTHSPTSVVASGDLASILTTSQPSLSRSHVPDKHLVSKSGPKQTESLSPFARQAQAKKKDTKSKSAKSKNKAKAVSEQSKQPKVDVRVREDQFKHEQRDNLLEPNTKIVGSNSSANATMQPRDVESTTKDRPGHEPTTPQVLSTLSSMTALLTGALSSMSTSTSKAKAEIDASSTSQLREAVQQEDTKKPQINNASSTAQTTVNGELQDEMREKTKSSDVITTKQAQVADDAESTTATQPEIDTAALSKKSKKNKKKKKKTKAKSIAPVRGDEDDVSSTETLTHETPVGSPSKATSIQAHASGNVLRQTTNMLDKTLSSLNIKEGSIISLGMNSVGFQATGTANMEENINLKVDSSVEVSRRKLQEMEEKERLLKQRKG